MDDRFLINRPRVWDTRISNRVVLVTSVQDECDDGCGPASSELATVSPRRVASRCSITGISQRDHRHIWTTDRSCVRRSAASSVRIAKVRSRHECSDVDETTTSVRVELIHDQGQAREACSGQFH